MTRRSRQQGFTLLEIVVAVAITAVVLTLSYQGFDAARRGVEGSRELLYEVNALDRTWQILSQDLRHLLPPSAVAANTPAALSGSVQRIFRGEPYYEDMRSASLVLQMTRGDWFNPTGRLRSDLQQVIYRVDEEARLWRDYRPDRNLPVEDWRYAEDFLHQPLLDNIHRIELRFLSAEQATSQGDGLLRGDDFSRDWEERWPAGSSFGSGDTSSVPDMPRALLIRIELASGTTSERLYAIHQFQ